jgi:HlyD family secretion protein
MLTKSIRAGTVNVKYSVWDFIPLMLRHGEVISLKICRTPRIELIGQCVSADRSHPALDNRAEKRLNSRIWLPRPILPVTLPAADRAPFAFRLSKGVGTVSPPESRTGKVFVTLLVAIAAYAAGAATLWFYAANPAANGRKSANRPAELSGEAVVALGRIRPGGGVQPVSGPPGDKIAEILVHEGDTVSAGQPLVRLASRLDREDELEMLDQQIGDAEIQSAAAKSSGEKEIEVAQSKLDEQNRLAPFDLKAQQTKLDLLERQRAVAEHRLQGMRDLQRISPNTVSDQDVEGQELLVAQTLAEIQAGTAQLAKAKAAQETGRKVAEAQLAASRANLERALRDIPLESLKKKRKLAKLQYDRTEVPAPTSGKVVKITGRKGDPTAPQQSILDLADTAAMQIVAEVYETDVAKLRKWGKAKVTIRSRALPNDLAGEISTIGTVIARNAVFDVDPTADTDRRVFEVVVTLDKPEDAALAAQFLNLQVQAFFEPVK